MKFQVFFHFNNVAFFNNIFQYVFFHCFSSLGSLMTYAVDYVCSSSPSFTFSLVQFLSLFAIQLLGFLTSAFFFSLLCLTQHVLYLVIIPHSFLICGGFVFSSTSFLHYASFGSSGPVVSSTQVLAFVPRGFPSQKQFLHCPFMKYHGRMLGQIFQLLQGNTVLACISQQLVQQFDAPL